MAVAPKAGIYSAVILEPGPMAPISLVEAARKYNVSEKMILEWLAAGEIRFYEDKGPYFYDCSIWQRVQE